MAKIVNAIQEDRIFTWGKELPVKLCSLGWYKSRISSEVALLVPHSASCMSKIFFFLIYHLNGHM